MNTNNELTRQWDQRCPLRHNEGLGGQPDGGSTGWKNHQNPTATAVSIILRGVHCDR
jgi:hypothetical protein